MAEPFEAALESACERLTGAQCPPRLAAAIRYALFPAGHRFRPRLCAAVSASLGMPEPALTHAAGVALEFVHTASLVQDDLPEFDNSWVRRGRPAVHAEFDAATAILASDALIAGAPQVLTAGRGSPYIKVELIHLVTEAIGSARGAVGGQAWELEDTLDIDTYHAAKTAALFEAATMMGAVAAKAEAEEWRAVGYHLGMAYQMADDIDDAAELNDGTPNALGTLTQRQAREACAAHLADARANIPRSASGVIDTFIDQVAGAFGVATGTAREANMPVRKVG